STLFPYTTLFRSDSAESTPRARSRDRRAPRVVARPRRRVRLGAAPLPARGPAEPLDSGLGDPGVSRHAGPLSLAPRGSLAVPVAAARSTALAHDPRHRPRRLFLDRRAPVPPRRIGAADLLGAAQPHPGHLVARDGGD